MSVWQVDNKDEYVLADVRADQSLDYDSQAMERVAEIYKQSTGNEICQNKSVLKCHLNLVRNLSYENIPSLSDLKAVGVYSGKQLKEKVNKLIRNSQEKGKGVRSLLSLKAKLN